MRVAPVGGDIGEEFDDFESGQWREIGCAVDLQGAAGLRDHGGAERGIRRQVGQEIVGSFHPGYRVAG